MRFEYWMVGPAMVNALQRLDEYLCSDASPETSFGLSDLDGFLVGAICTPEEISFETCLNVVLGNTETVPADIKDLIRQRHDEIYDGFATGQLLEPLFWQSAEGHVIAMDWCDGFMDAVKRWPAAWQRIMKTESGAQLMIPILVHLVDYEGNSNFGIAPEDLDAALDDAADRVAACVGKLYQMLRTSA
ncbi:UPF0149 family protein [Ruegeria sediminis]|nr:UPF0149 family protein [Ruegeria sediminis]